MAYTRAYYEQNKEKILEYQREYRNKPENRERKKKQRRAWYLKNRAAVLEKQRQWAAANPSYNSEYRKSRVRSNSRYDKECRLRVQYGITLEQWDEMFARQDGRCAICGQEASLHVDHDHETGQIRDLLCTRCNLGIGCFMDDPKTMSAAVEYAAKWKKGK
jgi:hypothetical protein